MRKAMNLKKKFIGSISLLLIVVMLLTCMPYFDFQADAAEAENPATQTGFNSVLQFQQAKWDSILDATFKGTVRRISGYTTDTQYNNAIPTVAEIKSGEIKVRGVGYFKWKEGLSDEWQGDTEAVTGRTETILYPSETVKGGNGYNYTANSLSVSYTVYDVENGAQLRWAMETAGSSNNSIKINITKDINLNGYNASTLYNDSTYPIWDAIQFNSSSGNVYIEGNGHTIYNMLSASGSTENSAAFIGLVSSSRKLVMKNLNFSNALTITKGYKSGTVIAYISGAKGYLENINIDSSFVYSSASNASTLIGRTDTSNGELFIRNCSSSNCYVFGLNHSGGLMGTQNNTATDYKIKYNADFPASPESWVFNYYKTQSKEGSTSTANATRVYSEMVENCYSVNSELFSLGNSGDSGGFISCGGKLVCRNSFTNNIVYGNTKTGAFLGRIVTVDSGIGGFYDDAGQQRVEIYFENCYASGTIEGQKRIGGFVGYEDQSGSGGYGVTVYKNCYTTAMVGMDYAGERLGGFIGQERTVTGVDNKKATIIIGEKDGNPVYNQFISATGVTVQKPGSVYINCYAAGEVGNILTDTNTDYSGTTYQGGFLGEAAGINTDELNPDKYSTQKNPYCGTYVNCYYDMQTTAMHERAVGRADQFILQNSAGTGVATEDDAVGESQIPGVTGVYTQTSTKKGVMGLTDTDGIMNDPNAWIYSETGDSYPELQCFKVDEQVKQNFATAYYAADADDETKARIDAILADKTEIVKQYSSASASTVLLEHWDQAMNMYTGSIGNESEWVPGLPVNKLSVVNYSSSEDNSRNKWEQDDDDLYWEISYNNLAAGDYMFKIQQGDQWTHDFGSDSYKGANCQLSVANDCDVKIKFDYVGEVLESQKNTDFCIWAEFYDSETKEYIGMQSLGKNVNAYVKNTWTVVGSFGSCYDGAEWNPAYTQFDMSYIGDAEYALTIDLKAGDYQFKIAKDNDWGESWGLLGEADSSKNNMSFSLIADARVRFTFDEESYKTEVTADPEYALNNVITVKEAINFKGYSLIAPKTITGYEWLDGLAAAQAGEMIYNAQSGLYEVTFEVPRYYQNENNNNVSNFDKIYGYKVITNAVDSGHNNYFMIAEPASGWDDSITSIRLTFTYNEETGVASVYSPDNDTNDLIQPNPAVSKYGVLGSEQLTGYDWGKDENGNEVADTGEMTQSGNIWTIKYEDVPAGTHAFKVAAECTFNSGIDYGANDGSGDYKITTDQVSDVIITFDESTTFITVETNPPEALIKQRYVVAGTKNLTGTSEDWDKSSEENEMTYDEVTGIFSKTYENLPNSENTFYTFKVVKFGKDNNDDNLSFGVFNGDTDSQEKYSLRIDYDPKMKTTEYHLYDSQGNLADDVLLEPDIEFYSVVGVQDLTGYDWLSDNENMQATNAGRMTADSDGWLVKTFPSVYVEPSTKSLSFKIVANGVWESGISYGAEDGGDYKFTISSQEYSSCAVTIKFNEETHEIKVTTTPDCLSLEDESQFEWYVCGESELVPGDSFVTPKTVYDTVRDITANFTFSASESKTWSIDPERNSASRFYSKIGSNAAMIDGDSDLAGFTLDYSIDGKNIQANFDEDIVSLSSYKNDEGYDVYKCDNFMPGKQWLKVHSSLDEKDRNGVTITGERNLRLIPTIYLEAGNSAEIKVLESESDTDATTNRNVVTYSNNTSSGVTFKSLDSGKTYDTTTIFGYYNLAFMSGYLATDRIGLGYYGSYSQQVVQEFDKDELRPNELDTTKTLEFFAMSGVFPNCTNGELSNGAPSEQAFYSDVGYYNFTMDSGQSGAGTNIAIDELVNQSLIGNSYYSKRGDSEDNYKGSSKTIIKIYKKVDGGYSKVFTDAASDSTSEYHTNYLKWTGQSAFEASDEGTYEVRLYWSLPDGRYRTDTKEVRIYSNLSSISKSVDTSYLEGNTNAEDKDITYTVTYQNGVEGDFKVCDVLPFDSDARYDTTKEDSKNSSVLQGSSFTLKSVSVTTEVINSVDSSSQPTIDNLKTYSTTSDEVTGYYEESYEEGISSSGESIQKLVPYDGVANKIDTASADSIWAEYTSGDISNVKGIAVTGTQKGEGTTKITIKYTISVDNAQIKDYFVNNAFFYTQDNDSVAQGYTNSIDGYSNVVTTAVVGRELSGYVWLDKNLNGRFDSSESPIEGITVTLLKKSGDYYSETGRTATTNADGYYCFTDIYDPDGDDFRVEFSAPSDPDMTILGQYTYSGLYLSRTLSPYLETDKSLSRNIARQVVGTSGDDKVYYIDEDLPSAEQIYQNNGRQRYMNGSIKNYLYTKPYQNLGLTNFDITAAQCSLTIKKVNTDGEAMEGVKFKLEYRYSEENDYEAIPGNVVDGKYQYMYSSASTFDIVATDENGEIAFTKLPIAQYRLTEVETLAGYNKLAESLEFYLPYVVNDYDLPEGIAVEGKAMEDGDENTYFDVTYTITNTPLPSMPLTGKYNANIPYIISIVLFALGGCLTVVYIVKTRKRKKTI